MTQHAQPAADAWRQHYNNGAVHFNAGRFAEAETSFRQVLALQPELAQAHMILGMCLQQQPGRGRDAYDAYGEALRRQPDNLEALNRLSALMVEQHWLNDALPVTQALVRRAPDLCEAALRLGNIHLFLDTPEKAEVAYRNAVVLEPGNHTATNNLGAALLSQCRIPEASVQYRRAVRLDPTVAENRKNLGTCRLLAGDFEEGTREYEWRVRQPVWKWNRSFPGKPEWDGSPLAGKTILVHFEQGLGDSFQFIRYMPVLQAMGARVVFECQASLKRLLSSAPGVDVLVGHGEPLPDFDCYVTLMSLMHRLGTTPGTVPGGVPYVRPEPKLVEAWGRRVDRDAFRIGINWHGNETAKSIPLELFEPIARIPGVRLYSLQKVKGLEQLGGLKERLGLIDWTAEMDAGPDAFVDTAAVMANMDLILTCDTSVTHLAGAMGLRTWMPLKWFADWRWLRDRDDSPWYPTTRIFRMARKHDWVELMGRVTAELERLVAAERPTPRA